jgi:hypothetical protein
MKALAGLGASEEGLYRRWGIPPRPENMSRPAGRPGSTMPGGGEAGKHPDRQAPKGGHASQERLDLPRGENQNVNAPHDAANPIPFCSRTDDSSI